MPSQWTPPEGNLRLGPPANTMINKPVGLEIPKFTTNTSLAEYAKTLDDSASAVKKKNNHEASAYLYGVLLTLAPVIHPHGSAETLWVQVRLSQSLYDSGRYYTASKLASNALVVADTLRSQGKSKTLLDTCVEIAARTIWSLVKKDYDSGQILQLHRASNNLEHSIGYLRKLFGSDNEYTKIFIAVQEKIDVRIREETQIGHRSRSPRVNQEPQVNLDQPQQPSTRQDGSTSPKPNVPIRGRKLATNDAKVEAEESSQQFLPVPGSDVKAKRRKSTQDPTRGTQKNEGLDGELSPTRPRSTSESGSPKDMGECFDAKPGDSLAIEPFRWAPLYESTGESSVSSLEKTHKFLMGARSGRYPKGNKKETRRVRIAVLDTGVDMTKIKKKKRIRCQECTVPGMEDQGGEDEAGHGTRIVQLLLDIAPEADIYSYRVFKNTKEVSSLVGIAPAITKAIKEEVDIINMSFGFQFLPINIRNELKNATAKDILIFAAASNSGAQPNLPVAWPAKEREVFAVFVTDNEGKPWEHNPPAVDMKPKFATLGKNVKPASAAADDRPVSGTSYATPIIAGTAALLIDFARLEPDDQNETFKYADAVHHYNSINALLLASSYPSDNGLSYVKPWQLFMSKNWNRVKIANKFEDVLQAEHGL